MKINKWTYHKTIQENWGYGWDSVDFYESDSTGFIKDREERQRFKDNLKAYRENSAAPVRVVTTKELNEAANT